MLSDRPRVAATATNRHGAVVALVSALLEPPPKLASLPETVLLVSVVVPLLWIPPPKTKEVGPGRDRCRSAVHHVFVQNVTVREHDVIDLMLADELHQLLFRLDGDSLGIKMSGQLGRIASVIDVRNLGGGEGDDLVCGIVAIQDVEVVKIPPGGTHDEDFSFHRRDSALIVAPGPLLVCSRTDLG